MRLFKKLNGAKGLIVEPVRLSAAPYSHGEGRLQVLFQMLGMVQSPERKLLTYGPESKLPGYAIGLDLKDFSQPAVKFPPLAALGYAVAEMILREPWSGMDSKPRVINDWDRFS